LLGNIRNRFQDFTKRKAEPTQLEQLQTELLAESTPDLAYLILIVGSCALAKRLRRRFATFGLLANSAAVIIGAMIIAPLMLPIRGLAFGDFARKRNLVPQGVDCGGDRHLASSGSRLVFGCASWHSQLWQ